MSRYTEAQLIEMIGQINLLTDSPMVAHKEGWCPCAISQAG